MKKLLVLLLATLMVISAFTACGKDESEKKADDKTKTESVVEPKPESKDATDADVNGGESEDIVAPESEPVSVPDVNGGESEDIVAPESEPVSVPEADSVDVEALKATAKAGMKDESIELPAEDVYNDTGINPETYGEGFWICEHTGNSAETVAFYVANSEAEGEAIRELLRGKLISLQNQYQDYNADNYQMTLEAVLGGSGVYAYMVISPNKADLVDAIKAAI